jgi:hypothetical protein
MSLSASSFPSRIGQRIIPQLARGLAAARRLDRPSRNDLADTYAMSMMVLFRLLFIACAEDRDILPCRANRLYQRRSLKSRALQLLRRTQPFDDSKSMWEEFDSLCRAIEQGNAAWGVPAYGGDLFACDPTRSPIGALLAQVALPDTVMGPVLRDLLLIDTPAGPAPVDFRHLDVRALGSVYEGLLESEVAIAQSDLMIDRAGFYRPWREGEVRAIEKGDVYLHNRSAARKATGTYFTSELIVDHLLDHALEPALNDHLALLDGLDEHAAAERFFDFRVADIAMGAAHFLVGAVDRIEQALTRYLARRPLPGVRRELADLRAAALTSLGNLSEQVVIEEAQLLRRMIARHCIYGVDVNPLAVTLARLALWMHSFVPGLPLSLLDYNLVEGDALTGIATASAREGPFPPPFPEVLGSRRAGFDVLLGNPPWEKARVEEHGFWARHQPGLRSLSQRLYEQERARLRHSRGDLVALLQRETEEAGALRKTLLRGRYPGMGTGDADLYKAFCWRFWDLVAAEGGRIGIVLPRSAFAAKGSSPFRNALLEGGNTLHVTMLVNNRHWVFHDVHPQYTIALAAACKRRQGQGKVSLLGPFTSPERFLQGRSRPPRTFSLEDVAAWTDTAALPLLPAEDSLEVFTRLRAHPRLDHRDPRSWRARPAVELHASGDKDLMDLCSEHMPEGFWPVYKGESFDVWRPTTGRYYAWGDPALVLPALLATRKRGACSKASPFSEFAAQQMGTIDLLPCRFPRIAFRDVTRATDSRTMRCALVPPCVLLTHKAPFLLFPRGDKKDEAYLLGILSSLTLDWYARRFVETAMTYHVLNPLPVPRPPRSSLLWQRVVALAGRLAAADARFAAWAEQVGVEHGPLHEAAKQDHIHELDAVVAHLYGLGEKQLGHVFETFHEGWDCSARLDATLPHYRAWRQKLV